MQPERATTSCGSGLTADQALPVGGNTYGGTAGSIVGAKARVLEWK